MLASRARYHRTCDILLQFCRLKSIFGTAARPTSDLITRSVFCQKKADTGPILAVGIVTAMARYPSWQEAK